jgi:hypothetical protein
MKSAWSVLFGLGVMAVASGAAAQDQCLERPKALNMVSHAGRASTSDFYYSAAGTLLEADGQEGVLVLDLESHGAVRFPLDGEFKMSADKRTRLHGVKDISLDDFQRGDRVQVKFSTFDGKVVRLKLKKPPK